MSTNMNDYLKRGDVLGRFTYYQGDRIPEVDVDNFPTTITFRDAKRVIREVSAADARPVVHARWEPEENIFDDSTWCCSSCHEPWTLIAGTPEENGMHFCPNCGAQMDGEEESTT